MNEPEALLVDPVTNRPRFTVPVIKRDPLTRHYTKAAVTDAFAQVKRCLATDLARPSVRQFPTSRDLFLAAVPKDKDEVTTDLLASMNQVLEDTAIPEEKKAQEWEKAFLALVDLDQGAVGAGARMLNQADLQKAHLSTFISDAPVPIQDFAVNLQSYFRQLHALFTQSTLKLARSPPAADIEVDLEAVGRLQPPAEVAPQLETPKELMDFYRSFINRGTNFELLSLLSGTVYYASLPESIDAADGKLSPLNLAKQLQLHINHHHGLSSDGPVWVHYPRPGGKRGEHIIYGTKAEALQKERAKKESAKTTDANKEKEPRDRSPPRDERRGATKANFKDKRERNPRPYPSERYDRQPREDARRGDERRQDGEARERDQRGFKRHLDREKEDPAGDKRFKRDAFKGCDYCKEHFPQSNKWRNHSNEDCWENPKSRNYEKRPPL